MPRGKKRAEPDEPETELAQKHRSVCKAVDDGAAELLCPITQELPIDPVMAEDGRVYDRSAIEQWLATNEKSPHTNEPMGKKLMPALQVKNVIAKMVESGALSGDKCEAWTKKLRQEKAVTDMRARAEAGDVEAMKSVAEWYEEGWYGLAQDPTLSFYWSKRAADLDDPSALYKISRAYYSGDGVPKDLMTAAVKMTQAAMLGSPRAIYSLAATYEYGWHGFAKSPSDALHWAKRLQSLSLSEGDKWWQSTPFITRIISGA